MKINAFRGNLASFQGPVVARPSRQHLAIRNATGNGASTNGSTNGVARHSVDWEPKSDIYILRSDGHSCARETVTPDGSLEFQHPSSQQQLLIWKTRPRCVMVLKKLGDDLISDFLDVIEFIGEEENLRVLVEPHEYQALKDRGFSQPWLDTWTTADAPHLASYVDFVCCLGGDGLVLHATHLFGASIPPVISFRLGSLGFLTCHDFSRHRVHLHNVINGYEELDTCRMMSSVDDSPLRGVHITLRMRLLCSIYRNGRPVPGAVHEVVNEVVLSRGSAPYLSKIDVYERDVLITKVQADGVMLATPTGSTAYSVSAGGSMVHPNVPAILMTPICPHSLSFRPVILPDYAKLELRIAGTARSGALATFDGKFPIELQPGDSLRVELSPHPVPTIDNLDQTLDWFSSIERCFGWNDRLEQLGMETREAQAAAESRVRHTTNRGSGGDSAVKQEEDVAVEVPTTPTATTKSVVGGCSKPVCQHRST